MHERVSVEVDGSGPPVVLVHASGLSSRQWRGAWVEQLQGYRRVTLDLWGCGKTGNWPGPWPFRLEHDLASVRALLERHGPAHLVGHSYGGSLALYAAAEQPHLVRSVAVYEPPLMGLVRLPPEQVVGPLTDPALAGTEAWYRGFVDWWNGPGVWDGLPEASRAAQLAAGLECFGHVQDLLRDPRGQDHYARLTAPVLLLHGTRSPQVIRDALVAFAEGRPNTRLQELGGLDHLAPVTRPARVAPTVRAHLDAA